MTRPRSRDHPGAWGVKIILESQVCRRRRRGWVQGCGRGRQGWGSPSSDHHDLGVHVCPPAGSGGPGRPPPRRTAVLGGQGAEGCHCRKRGYLLFTDHRRSRGVPQGLALVPPCIFLGSGGVGIGGARDEGLMATPPMGGRGRRAWAEEPAVTGRGWGRSSGQRGRERGSWGGEDCQRLWVSDQGLVTPLS